MSSTLLYITTVLVWGSTWFAIEFQLGEVAPEVSLVYRYAGASGLLFCWCRLKGLKLGFPIRQHGWFVLLGALLFGINYMLAYRAQIYITSALTAIAFSTMLWMNILNARVFFGVRASGRVVVGAILGVAGIAILFAPQIADISLTDATMLGSILAVSSAFVASLGNIVSQRAQRENLPVIQSNAWGMFYGSLISAVAAFVQGHEFAFEFSAGYVVSLAYLTVFGSIVAFGAYLTLLGRIGAHRAGYAMIMFPVVALVLSVAFEGLRVDWTMMAGVTLVLTGNLFVLRQAKSTPRALRGPMKLSAEHS